MNHAQASFATGQSVTTPPAKIAEQRAIALFIAALSSPEPLIRQMAELLDATCPPEQPIARIILLAADWLDQQVGPYGDLPWATPHRPDLRRFLAQSGLTPNFCAALERAYAKVTRPLDTVNAPHRTLFHESHLHS